VPEEMPGQVDVPEMPKDPGPIRTIRNGDRAVVQDRNGAAAGNLSQNIRVAQQLNRERDVVRGKWLSVVPPDVAPQVIGPRQLVLGVLPTPGEHTNQIAISILVEHWREEQSLWLEIPGRDERPFVPTREQDCKGGRVIEVVALRAGAGEESKREHGGHPRRA